MARLVHILSTYYNTTPHTNQSILSSHIVSLCPNRTAGVEMCMETFAFLLFSLYILHDPFHSHGGRHIVLLREVAGEGVVGRGNGGRRLPDCVVQIKRDNPQLRLPSRFEFNIVSQDAGRRSVGASMVRNLVAALCRRKCNRGTYGFSLS